MVPPEFRIFWQQFMNTWLGRHLEPGNA
jgi:hypothetical protein